MSQRLLYLCPKRRKYTLNVLPLAQMTQAMDQRMCSSRKNPYPPHGSSLEIPRGRGLLAAKILEAEYEAKLEFPGGRGGGVQNKKPSVGGVWIFLWNCTIINSVVYVEVLIN